jgi:hypothetical protein
MGQVSSPAALGHFSTFGEVYATLDACDQVQLLLGRLRREQLLGEEEYQGSRQQIAEIRASVERYITQSALLPKGPRLP